jgi:mannosyl-3-phosphoglycerate phosphatase
MPGKKSSDRIVFTDLDGTLLDSESYSWKPAEPALMTAKKNNVPVIFCSSKTRAEIELYRKKTKNNHPFVIENGEAIYIPHGYFRHRPPKCKKLKDYLVVVLGKPYKELRNVMEEMKASKLSVRGFGDMDVQEIAELTGLGREEAKLARKREYDEPFVIKNPGHEEKVLDFINKRGLQCTRGGRFYHLLGSNDKGLAVKMLASIYDYDAGRPIVTAGIGDSQNDFPMLKAVHVPYLLRKKNGKYASSSMAYIRVDGNGPAGWNSAIMNFLLEEI